MRFSKMIDSLLTIWYCGSVLWIADRAGGGVQVSTPTERGSHLERNEMPNPSFVRSDLSLAEKQVAMRYRNSKKLMVVPLPRNARRRKKYAPGNYRSRNECFAYRHRILLNGCLDCGESDLATLDFDHIRDIKIADISWLVQYGNLALLRKEIAKCDVRCSNCHRKRHARVRAEVGR